MKFIKPLLFILLVFPTCLIKGQTVIDTTKISPSEIPSPEVLRSMGIPEALIQKIINYKNGAYNMTTNRVDTTQKYNVQKLPLFLNDTTRNTYIDTTNLNLKKYPAGRIFGQDLFRNQNLKFFNKASQSLAPDNYVLGAGDMVSISVWGFAQYNEAFNINTEGYITPRNIGRVYVKGLKFGEAKELLRQKISEVTDLKNSHIDIVLNYSRVINVNIVGEVYNPGTYTIPALNTVFNALIAASGPTQIGSVRSIYLKRNNKIVDSLDVYKFLTEPDSKDDIYLENNDYIIVPAVKRVATVTGNFNRPHNYELKGKETINTLIKYAGGLLPGSYTMNVQVKRFANSKLELININLDSLKNHNIDFIINDGDQVFIDRISQELTNISTVIGSVKIPGSYQFKEGERISDLLSQAQGITFDAYTKMAYITRKKEDLTKKYVVVNLGNILNNKAAPDNILLEKFDTLYVLSKNNFNDYLKISVYGSVRKPGVFDYGENISLKDIIFMAGGLKQEAANNRIEISRIIDFDKTNNKAFPIRTIVNTVQVGMDLSISEEAQNFILQPYDHVYVRANPDFDLPKKVFLIGEFMYPGIYSLTSKKETIADVISRAGGFTKYAFIDGASMNRKYKQTGFIYINLDKALKRPHSKYNIVLNDSDSIYIPKIVDLVHISGAIGNANIQSISVPYFGSRRAKFYIKHFAGGFARNSRRAGTSVIYPNGILKQTKDFWLIRIYPKVRNGSIVQIPYADIKSINNNKSQPIDWNKAIENATIKMTALLTLWLIITKLKP